MKKLLIILTSVLFIGSAYSQETDESDQRNQAIENLDFHLDIKSSHLWRGIVVTSSPMAAVDINYALDKNKNFKVGVWGGLGLSDDDGLHYQEINYYLSYSTEKFGIGFWDVFNSSGRIKGEKNNKIFNYSRKNTGHRFDLRAFAILSERYPFRLELGTSIYGDDRENDLAGDKDQRLSSYVELGYPVIQGKKINLNAFLAAGIGLAGKSHFYGNGKNDFDIVNFGVTATRDFYISNYKLPVSATVMWNPSNDYARVQIAATVF